MGHWRCSVCLTRQSSRFYVVLTREIDECFGLNISHEKYEESVCASCRRRLTRRKNFENVNTRPTQERGFLRAAVNREKRKSTLRAERAIIQGEELRQPIASVIYDLPVEIIVNIAISLEIKDVISFSQTSKTFSKIVNIPSVWKKLLERDFPFVLPTETSSCDFKMLYSNLHKVNKDCMMENRFLAKKNETQASLIDDLTMKVSQIGSITSELSYAKEELQTSKRSMQKYEKLRLDRDPSTAVTQEQEQVFMNVLKKKQGRSNDGFIWAYQEKGKPIRLHSVPQAIVGTSDAASSTVKKRSQLLEKLHENVAVGKCKDKKTDLIDQQASLITRKKELFHKAADKAGINILATFSLKQVAELKAHMPMEMLRMLKRSFKVALGYDVFGSETQLREQLKTMEFEYECGTFKTIPTSDNGDVGKEVSFLRVVNVEDVIRSTIQELSDSRKLQQYENIPNDVLWFLLSGDKGGPSTKLLFQVLNTEEQHSVKAARLLAIFEGAKDNYECLKAVFEPVVTKVKNALQSFQSLELSGYVNHCPRLHHPTINTPLYPEHITVSGSEQWPAGMDSLDVKNTYISKSCKLCKHGITFTEYDSLDIQAEHSYCRSKCDFPQQNQSESNPQKEMLQKFSNWWLTLGGDWEFIAKMLGLTGPNGTHFCNFCLCTIADLRKGIPHTPTPLKKYEHLSPKPNNYQERSFTSLIKNQEAYAEAGSVKTKVNKFENCENLPLFQQDGSILDSVSCMPLHISLGLGKQALDLVEQETIRLDDQIKQENGKGGDRLQACMEQRRSLCQYIATTEEELEELNVTRNISKEERSTMLETRECYLAKENGRFKLNSQIAIQSRKDIRLVSQKLNNLEKQIKKKENELKEFNKELTVIKEKIESLQGPFQTRLTDTLGKMSLKRQVYHKGALVGNDVNKLLQNGNIHELVKVFKPTRIEMMDNTNRVYSDTMTMNRISTLLYKLRSCYNLYSISRPLCRHEVCYLKIRCASLGCWFPTAFKSSSLIRKFHVLTHHVPQKAELRTTVGMEAEHCSESIHPVVNKLNRTYATTQNACERLKLVAKSQWLQSNATLKNYRKPIPRNTKSSK